MVVKAIRLGSFVEEAAEAGRMIQLEPGVHSCWKLSRSSRASLCNAVRPFLQFKSGQISPEFAAFGHASWLLQRACWSLLALRGVR